MSRRVFLISGNFGKTEMALRNSRWGSAGTPCVPLVRSEIMGDSGLGAHHDVVSDFHVIHDADLAGQDDIASDLRRTRYAHLGHNDGVFADDDIMSNLDKVVNLHPSSDDRLAQGCPINRRIGTDFNIVFDFNASHLGDLDVLLSFLHISKSITPHHHATMKDDPFSNHRSRIDGDIWIDDRLLTNGGILTDKDARVKDHPISNPATVSEIDKGIDGDVFSQLGSGADPGLGINAFGLVGFVEKEADDLGKG